jgi:uncharacterized protein YegL
MVGPPLEAVGNGVVTMLAALRKNPYAMETVCLSIITFGAKARQVVPLTEVQAVPPPRLSIQPGTSLGAALDLLRECIEAEVVKTTASQKGDFRPLVFILTDGQPTDQWAQAADRLRGVKPRLAHIYAIGCGDEVDFSPLSRVADLCIYMRGLSTDSFAKFFVWMSASVQSLSVSTDDRVSLEKMPLSEGLELVDPAAPPPVAPGGQKLYFHVCCRKTRRHYLLRYRNEPQAGVYLAQDAFPLPDDFFADGSLKSPSISSDLLYGAVGCPFCGSAGWGQCGFCHHLFCLDENFDEPNLTCPVCETALSRGHSGSFGVQGSLG